MSHLTSILIIIINRSFFNTAIQKISSAIQQFGLTTKQKQEKRLNKITKKWQNMNHSNKQNCSSNLTQVGWIKWDCLKCNKQTRTAGSDRLSTHEKDKMLPFNSSTLHYLKLKWEKQCLENRKHFTGNRMPLYRYSSFPVRFLLSSIQWQLKASNDGSHYH